MGAAKGILAALAAFGASWAALSWSPDPAPEAAASPSLASPPPPGGTRVSLRRVVFNGSPSTVAVYRFDEPPGRVLERVAADLAARGLSGREALTPLLPAERREYEAGRFFLADRRPGGERLRWRHPEAGTVEAFLRPERGGTCGVWSERKGGAWVPDGGDCPGRDLEGVARPEGWRRLFCIDASDRRMLCYAASGDPESAAGELARRLEASGWTPGAGSPGSAGFVRGGRRCRIGAEPAPGGSQVTVIEEGK